jgi:hypothetical protein
VNTYLLKNLTDVQSAKTLLEDRSTKSTHIKEIVVGKDTHHLTYPSIDYVTNMWQSACVNWSDTYANRGSLTGEHSLYLDEQPWIDN